LGAVVVVASILKTKQMKVKRFANDYDFRNFWYETETGDRVKCDINDLNTFYIEWLTEAGSTRKNSEDFEIFTFSEAMIFNI
tara:strand:- start:135 stop:380 length:246 start_codon:yes stop_codon:yes gene_type:complete